MKTKKIKFTVKWATEPCPHLRRVFEVMRKNNITITCSEWASFTCEQCGLAMNESDLLREVGKK